MKINVDGSIILNHFDLELGGLFRDCQGDWLFGFTMRLSLGCNILRAEVAAIYWGLKFAWDRG